ncbi:MAG: hypothetical protein ACTHJ8_14305 [Mucilaginibacter sp.]
MKENRRLAHEMTPVILEEFGLKDAVKDMCLSFGKELNIKFSFIGAQKLQQCIEVIIYRSGIVN